MDILPEYFRPRFHAEALPEAVIVLPRVRFSVLTARMIRIEYNPVDRFEDRPSQVFWYRRQPVPEYTVHNTVKEFNLDTGFLRVSYKLGKKFTSETLSIELKEDHTTWHYGDVETDNLLGTTRTLDTKKGRTPLEPGLVSRSGWTLVDDSRSLVFDSNGWLVERGAPAGAVDIYFLGYGKAFQDCLSDFCKASGQTAMIPRWALGNWWSRYWEYSDPELRNLMESFRRQQIPLGVCIVDMDWHITDTGNQCSGWTGYTWNRELFPDPPAFLDFLHNMGLKTALNLHPAEGIHAHEGAYVQMAEAMGIDPRSKKPVPFDLLDARFIQAYFNLLHHPLEAQGVDFWWMDWQQGNPTRLPGLNLLWWINHLHFLDLGREPRKRSFIFSRWGGLGNHRYPIGFSGDTVVSWESLSFQPYMTATAANVGFGWWSHDIGGHMGGIEDRELYTRWVQWGVLSPIMRMHCTKNAYHERRPWGYDDEILRITRKVLQLRHALIPYLYSMAWRNHKQGIPLMRPMYYLYPEAEEAYHCPNQYAYGSELIAAPYTKPADAETRLSRQVVWLPKGDWYDFFSGNYYPGDNWNAIYGGLDEIPVFAKAGAIVPLGPMLGWGGVGNPEELTVHVFPGADNSFDLYEDDGESAGYLHGDYAITRFTQGWKDKQQSLSIHPVEGQGGFLPPSRAYTFVFHAIVSPDNIRVKVNGTPVDYAHSYDENKRSLSITDVRLAPADKLEIELSCDPSLVVRVVDPLSRIRKMLNAFRMDTWIKAGIDRALPEILEQPAKLAAAKAYLSPAQMRALLEVICGAGIERITNAGEDKVVFWNNSLSEEVTYLITSSRPRMFTEQEKIPKFTVSCPEKEFPKSPMVYWQVDYGVLLKIFYSKRSGELASPYTEEGML